MSKRKRAVSKNHLKFFDSNVTWQTVFGLASIICAVMVYVFDRSLSTLFDVLKDIFGTAMVFVVFVVAVHHFRERFAPKKDKLDYIDFWDDYKEDIYSDNIASFLKPLVYGLQAATYSGEETQRLHDHIDNILESKKRLSTSTRGVLNMVRAILLLFIKTQRLNEPLTDEKAYGTITAVLSYPCENDIDDPELAAWCRIFRNDKLELTYECYAAGLPLEQKKIYLNNAFNLIDKECLPLIEQQQQKNPDDENYARLYLSYLYRNIAQIKIELYKIDGDEKDRITADEYILKTFDLRDKLYTYFQNERKAKTLTSDYITQEYVLSLGEKHDLETDPNEKEDIKNKIHMHYDNWKLQSETRDMLLKKITEVINKIESPKE